MKAVVFIQNNFMLKEAGKTILIFCLNLKLKPNTDFKKIPNYYLEPRYS